MNNDTCGIGSGDHLGEQVSIRGYSGVERGGRRHPQDTKESLVLTLYDQAGEMRELTVPRTRDLELFQEWLRRFDRYTPKGRDERAGIAGR